MGPQETTCKDNFFCTGVYVHRRTLFLNRNSEQQVQKDGIAVLLNAIGRESLANFIAKYA